MSQLVECIPNFSEARRPAVIDEIVAAIQSIHGVQLLDRSSDLDHNRTVLTFAGTPAAVEAAAFQAIRRATELIDLDHHTGQHPRIGAADVVPFVPLSDVSMDECVAMARRLGKRVGEELGVPVYLYEYAATRADRTNLENLRRGQYEGLMHEIETDPNRRPDFGPAHLGPAGATVIGARDPLIAFNVYLTTAEVETAKKIAKAIRHSSGGLRFVKALGLLVEGRAQVSINLTNFRQSPIAQVVEFIRREARRHGAEIHHSELVGLIPQDALVDAAVWYTQLDGLGRQQVLEERLYQARAAGPAVEQYSFLDRVAAATPAPGGGSVAAFAAALGASLAEMVAGLTMGKVAYKDVEPEMREIARRAADLRIRMQAAVEDDARAYEAVMSAYRLPRGTSEETATRKRAIDAAMLEAARVPLETARGAMGALDLLASCASRANVNALSDSLSGVAMARAALTSAGSNVRVNLHGHPDTDTSTAMLKELAALEKRAADVAADIDRTARSRSNGV